MCSPSRGGSRWRIDTMLRCMQSISFTRLALKLHQLHLNARLGQQHLSTSISFLVRGSWRACLDPAPNQNLTHIDLFAAATSEAQLPSWPTACPNTLQVYCHDQLGNSVRSSTSLGDMTTHDPALNLSFHLLARRRSTTKRFTMAAFGKILVKISILGTKE